MIQKTSSRRCRRCGMITLVNAVTVAFCAILIVLVINVGHLVHQKIETQNAADAVAYSGAVWNARGMNAVTATNHVMGEMLSFAVLHEAIGGKRLDDPSLGPANTRRLDREIDRARWLAARLGARTPAYSTVRQRSGIYADRTLLDSKKQLKRWLTRIYYAKAIAKLMQRSRFPPVVAAGIALEIAMDAFEGVIWAEYKILKAVHRTARGLLGMKRLLRDQMLPAAKEYTSYVKEQAPVLAEKAAGAIAKANGAKGTLFPFDYELPIVVDPFARRMAPNIPDSQRVPASRRAPRCRSVRATNMRDQVVKTSQLARATWPWVNYHRQPILRTFGVLLPFSRARTHYFHHTAGAAKYLCDVLQRGRHDLGLYVLRGYPAPDKGYALWTKDAEAADDLFTVIGLAHRARTLVVGEEHVFRNEHEDGRLALAQAIIYNANPQNPHPHHHNLRCKRIMPIRQAGVGWDTLNWKPNTRPYELVGISIPASFPEIKVNWQAKLVPITANRYRQLRHSSETPAPFRGVIDRMVPSLQPSMRTH